RADQFRLPQIQPASKTSVTCLFVLEEGRIREHVDEGFGDDDPDVASEIVRAPKPLVPAARESSETAVLLLEPAEPVLDIAVSKEHVVPVINLQAALEAR